ncbi:hypothetical protein BC941DRAFT_419401 [Chlamydoabsidia padenii]|nr:hypothetical protein BC941DRAFT_419401 [Chlamydoabsidia padenii]
MKMCLNPTCVIWMVQTIAVMCCLGWTLPAAVVEARCDYQKNSQSPFVLQHWQDQHYITMSSSRTSFVLDYGHRLCNQYQ